MNIELNKEKYNVDGDNIIIKITPESKVKLGLQKVRLSTLPPGSIIKSDIDVDYIVLCHFSWGGGTTRIIRKDLLPDNKRFDNDCNNFATSEIKDFLNGQYLKEELIPGFGETNILEHEIDLLSMDGFNDYGKCTVKVGLQTFDDYRKYHKTLFKKNMKKSWMLATPDSTPSGYGDGYVRCVCSRGGLVYDDCSWDNRGVRPDLELKSDIFVSLVK